MSNVFLYLLWTFQEDIFAMPTTNEMCHVCPTVRFIFLCLTFLSYLLLYSLLSKAETYMLDLFVNVISQTKFQLYATKKQSFPIDPHYKKTPTFGNVTYIHNMPKVFVFTKRVRILWRNSMSFVVSDWNSVSDYIKTRRRISCKLQLEMTMNKKF